jgi:hypothetical protein
LEASDEAVAMLGTKARVAAAFKSVGFHERDTDLGRDEREREIVVVKSEKMGPIRDPHLDYGQGKIIFDCTDIHDRAKGRRRRLRDHATIELPPKRAPVHTPPDGKPPPTFKDVAPLGAAQDIIGRTDLEIDAGNGLRQLDMAMDDGGGEEKDPPADLDMDVDMNVDLDLDGQNGRGVARCPPQRTWTWT